jgi:hypothetical protein
MNATEHAIIGDIVSHPGTQARDIAERLHFSPERIRYYLRGSLKPLVRRTNGKRGSGMPSTYTVREDLDWCPYCGRVME